MPFRASKNSIWFGTYDIFKYAVFDLTIFPLSSSSSPSNAFPTLKCFHFFKSFQTSQLHEILCEPSLNNSLGGVFQDFSKFLFFHTFWDFRKLVLIRDTAQAHTLKCFRFFKSYRSSQLHEILCEPSSNNSLGGVFQDFFRFLFFHTFWDFRKLVLLYDTEYARCRSCFKVFWHFLSS